jgi:hypothetical protein
VKPYTLTDAEDDLRAALDAGVDAGQLDALAQAVDRLDRHPPPAATGATALWYAQRGLHVFPCRPLAKVPITRNGVKDATLDPETISRWWTNHPDANVAIATGWLVDVWDFDGPTAWLDQYMGRDEHWSGSWAQHQEDFEPEPGEVLAKVSTPRPGGIHWWVRAEPYAKNGKHLWPGIDYRAHGGYVVAPPSVTDDRDHQVAGTYRFLTHDGLDTLEVW